MPIKSSDAILGHRFKMCDCLRQPFVYDEYSHHFSSALIDEYRFRIITPGLWNKLSESNPYIMKSVTLKDTYTRRFLINR